MADLDDLGRTALGVTWARAAESSSGGALFRDPLAEAIARVRPPSGALAGGDVELGGASAGIRSMYHWIVARTVFLDDVLAAAVAGGITQFVILGSGLDGRGFRLDLGSRAKLFEVDRPSVIEVKEDLVAQSGLQPTVERRVVASDLADDWLRALQDKGFRADLPSAWLAEGLLVYLSDDMVKRVIEGVTAAAESGSRIGVTIRSRTHIPPAAGDPFADVRKLWRSTIDVASHLDAAGWSCEVTTAREVLAAHGRLSSQATSGESAESAGLANADPADTGLANADLTDTGLTGAERSATLLSGVRRERGHATIDRS